MRRYEILIGVLDRELESGQVEKRIQMRVKGQMEKNQREYYLNEQMKAIKKELGLDPETAEAEEEEAKLERQVRDAQMPKEALENDAAVVLRSERRAQLRRDASRTALEEEEPRQPRHRTGSPCPR